MHPIYSDTPLATAFNAIDQHLDILDNRFPRINYPYPVNDAKAILEAVEPLEVQIHQLWKEHAPTLSRPDCIHLRGLVMRLLSDITRFRLDAATPYIAEVNHVHE